MERPTGDSVSRFQRGFVLGVAVFLGLTGGVKLVSVLGESRVLGTADPLVPWLTVRQMLFLAATLELGVAVVLWRHRQARWAPWLIQLGALKRGVNLSRATVLNCNGRDTTPPSLAMLPASTLYTRRPFPLLGALFLMSIPLMSRDLPKQEGDITSSLPSDAGALFRKYLENTPPVKLIVFDQWCRIKYGPAYYRAEGAFQPAGYYLLYPSNSAYIRNMWISGLSDEYEWEYVQEYKACTYGPRRYWDQGFWSMNFTPLLILRTAICLGMPHLPGDFKWTTTNTFEFLNRWEWEGAEDGKKYHGRILRQDALGRPEEIEMWTTYKGRRDRFRRVVYSYEDEGFLPTRFEMVFLGDQRNISLDAVTRFVLHKLDVGLDPRASTGYRMKDFLGPDCPVEDLTFISNKVAYHVMPDGTHTPVQYSNPPPPDPRLGQRTAIVALGVPLAGFLIFWLSRLCGKINRKTTTKTPS